MRLSEVDLDLVKSYCNVYYTDDDELIESIIMPSAQGYIASSTKRTLADLDKYPEIVIAYMIICAYMYDNRSMEVSSSEINNILKTTLGMHTFYNL